jgi:hypothetical protein
MTAAPALPQQSIVTLHPLGFPLVPPRGALSHSPSTPRVPPEQHPPARPPAAQYGVVKLHVLVSPYLPRVLRRLLRRMPKSRDQVRAYAVGQLEDGFPFLIIVSARTRTCSHTPTRSHTHAHIHTHAHTRTHTHDTHTHAHTHTRARTHAHAHTTHTRTHTHCMP